MPGSPASNNSGSSSSSCGSRLSSGDGYSSGGGTGSSNLSSSHATSSAFRRRSVVDVLLDRGLLFSLVGQLEQAPPATLSAAMLVVQCLQMLSLTVNSQVQWDATVLHPRTAVITKMIYFFQLPLFDANFVGGSTDVSFALGITGLALVIALITTFFVLFFTVAKSETQVFSRGVRGPLGQGLQLLATVAFVPMISNAMAFTTCDSTYTTMFWFPQHACGGPVSTALTAVGATTTIVTASLTGLYALMLFEDAPNSTHFAACADGAVQTVRVAAIAALVVLYHLLVPGRYAVEYCSTVAVVLFAAATLPVALLLPHFWMRTNRIISAFSGMAAAVAAVAAGISSAERVGGSSTVAMPRASLVTALSPLSATTQWATAISPTIPVLVGVMLVTCALCWWLPSWRVNAHVPDAVARVTAGSHIVDNRRTFPNHLPVNDLVFSEFRDIETSIKEAFEYGGAGEEERPQAPVVLMRPFIANVYRESDIEVAARTIVLCNELVVGGPPIDTVLYTARIFVKGMARFRSSDLLLLQFSHFLLAFGRRERMAMAICERLATSANTPFPIAYRATRLLRRLKQILNVADPAALRVLNSSLRYHQEALSLMQAFWWRLLTRTFDAAHLCAVANAITQRREDASEHYRRALQNPSRNVLVQYAKFLDQVMIDTRQAAEIRDRVAEEAEVARQRMLAGKRGGGGDHMTMTSTDSRLRIRGDLLTQATAHDMGESASTSIQRLSRTVLLTILALCLCGTGFFLYDYFKSVEMQTRFERVEASSRLRTLLPHGAFVAGEVAQLASTLTATSSSSSSSALLQQRFAALQREVSEVGSTFDRLHRDLTTGGLAAESGEPLHEMLTLQRVEVVRPDASGRSLSGAFIRSQTDLWSLGFEVTAAFAAIAAAIPSDFSRLNEARITGGNNNNNNNNNEKVSTSVAMDAVRFLRSNALGNAQFFLNESVFRYSESYATGQERFFWVAVGLVGGVQVLLFLAHTLLMFHFDQIAASKLSVLGLFGVIPRVHCQKLHTKMRALLLRFGKDDDDVATIADEDGDQPARTATVRVVSPSSQSPKKSSFQHSVKSAAATADAKGDINAASESESRAAEGSMSLSDVAQDTDIDLGRTTSGVVPATVLLSAMIVALLAAVLVGVVIPASEAMQTTTSTRETSLKLTRRHNRLNRAVLLMHEASAVFIGGGSLDALADYYEAWAATSDDLETMNVLYGKLRRDETNPSVLSDLLVMRQHTDQLLLRQVAAIWLASTVYAVAEVPPGRSPDPLAARWNRTQYPVEAFVSINASDPDARYLLRRLAATEELVRYNMSTLSPVVAGLFPAIQQRIVANALSTASPTDERRDMAKPLAQRIETARSLVHDATYRAHLDALRNAQRRAVSEASSLASLEAAFRNGDTMLAAVVGVACLLLLCVFCPFGLLWRRWGRPLLGIGLLLSTAGLSATVIFFASSQLQATDALMKTAAAERAMRNTRNVSDSLSYSHAILARSFVASGDATLAATYASQFEADALQSTIESMIRTVAAQTDIQGEVLDEFSRRMSRLGLAFGAARNASAAAVRLGTWAWFGPNATTTTKALTAVAGLPYIPLDFADRELNAAVDAIGTSSKEFSTASLQGVSRDASGLSPSQQMWAARWLLNSPSFNRLSTRVHATVKRLFETVDSILGTNTDMANTKLMSEMEVVFACAVSLLVLALLGGAMAVHTAARAFTLDALIWSSASGSIMTASGSFGGIGGGRQAEAASQLEGVLSSSIVFAARVAFALISVIAFALLGIEAYHWQITKSFGHTLHLAAARESTIALSALAAQDIFSGVPHPNVVPPSALLLDTVNDLAAIRNTLYFSEQGKAVATRGEIDGLDVPLLGPMTYEREQFSASCISDEDIQDTKLTIQELGQLDPSRTLTPFEAQQLQGASVEELVQEWQVLMFDVATIAANTTAAADLETFERIQGMGPALVHVEGVLESKLRLSTEALARRLTSNGAAPRIAWVVVSSIFLTTLVLSALIVFRPVLTQLQREEQGTRLLLRMIPPSVRSSVPAIKQYLESGSLQLDESSLWLAETMRRMGAPSSIVTDTGGVMLHVTPAALRLFGGYDSADLVGRNVSMLMPESIGRNHSAFLHADMNGGPPHVIDVRRRVTGRRRDGSTFSCFLQVKEMQRRNGEVTFVGFLSPEDHEEAASLKNSVHTSVLDACSSVFILTTGRGRILSVNRTVTDVLGYTPEELVGTDVGKLTNVGPTQHEQYMRQYAQTGVKRFLGRTNRLPVPRKSGAEVLCDITVREFVNEDSSRLFCATITNAGASAHRVEMERSNAMVLEGSEYPIIGINKVGIITIFSRAAEKLWDLPAAEAIGRNVTILMNDIDATRHGAYLQRYAKRQGPSKKLQSRRSVVAKHRNGDYLNLDLVITSVSNLPNNTRYVAYARDTRETDADARQAEVSAALIDASPDAFVAIDEAGIIVSVNQAAMALFGHARIDLVNSAVTKLMPHEVAVAHDGYVQRYLHTGVPTILNMHRPVEAVHASGHTFGVFILVREVWARRPSPTFPQGLRIFYALFRSTKAEKATRLNNQDASRITDANPNPIIAIDEEGMVVVFNRAAQTFFDYADPAEVIGQSVNRLMPEAVANQHDGFLAKFFAARKSEDAEAAALLQRRAIVCKTRSGHLRHARITIRFVSSSTAGSIFVSELENIEEDMKVTNEAARGFRCVFGAPMPIIITNSTGRIISMNECAASTFMWSIDDAMGRSVGGLIPASLEIDHAALMTRYVERRQQQRQQQRLRQGSSRGGGVESEDNASRVVNHTRPLVAVRRDGVQIEVKLTVREISRASVLNLLTQRNASQLGAGSFSPAANIFAGDPKVQLRTAGSATLHNAFTLNAIDHRGHKNNSKSTTATPTTGATDCDRQLFVGFFEDMTQRRLQSATSALGQIAFSESVVPMARISANGVIVDSSRSLAAVVGAPSAEALRNRPIADFVIGDIRTAFRRRRAMDADVGGGDEEDVSDNSGSETDDAAGSSENTSSTGNTSLTSQGVVLRVRRGDGSVVAATVTVRDLHASDSTIEPDRLVTVEPLTGIADADRQAAAAQALSTFVAAACPLPGIVVKWTHRRLIVESANAAFLNCCGDASLADVIGEPLGSVGVTAAVQSPAAGGEDIAGMRGMASPPAEGRSTLLEGRGGVVAPLVITRVSAELLESTILNLFVSTKKKSEKTAAALAPKSVGFAPRPATGGDDNDDNDDDSNHNGYDGGVRGEKLPPQSSLVVKQKAMLRLPPSLRRVTLSMTATFKAAQRESNNDTPTTSPPITVGDEKASADGEQQQQQQGTLSHVIAFVEDHAAVDAATDALLAAFEVSKTLFEAVLIVSSPMHSPTATNDNHEKGAMAAAVVETVLAGSAPVPSSAEEACRGADIFGSLFDRLAEHDISKTFSGSVGGGPLAFDDRPLLLASVFPALDWAAMVGDAASAASPRRGVALALPGSGGGSDNGDDVTGGSTMTVDVHVAPLPPAVHDAFVSALAPASSSKTPAPQRQDIRRHLVFVQRPAAAAGWAGGGGADRTSPSRTHSQIEGEKPPPPALLAHMPFPTAIVDSSGTVLAVSPTFEAAFGGGGLGADASSALPLSSSRSVHNLFDATDAATILEHFRRAALTGVQAASEPMPVTARRADNSAFAASVVARAVAEPRPLARLTFVLVVRPLEAQEALAAAVAMEQGLLATAPSPVLVTDEGGVIVAASARCERQFGCAPPAPEGAGLRDGSAPSPMAGRHVTAFLPLLHGGCGALFAAARLKGTAGYVAVVQARTLVGEALPPLTMHVHESRLDTAAASIASISATPSATTSAGPTSAATATATAATSRYYYTFVFEATPQEADVFDTLAMQQASRQLADPALVMVDAHGTITDASPAAAGFLHFSSAEHLVGQPVGILVPPEQRAWHDRVVQHYAASNKQHGNAHAASSPRGGGFGFTRRVMALRGDGTQAPIAITLWDVATGASDDNSDSSASGRLFVCLLQEDLLPVTAAVDAAAAANTAVAQVTRLAVCVTDEHGVILYCPDAAAMTAASTAAAAGSATSPATSDTTAASAKVDVPSDLFGCRLEEVLELRDAAQRTALAQHIASACEGPAALSTARSAAPTTGLLEDHDHNEENRDDTETLHRAAAAAEVATVFATVPAPTALHPHRVVVLRRLRGSNACCYCLAMVVLNNAPTKTTA